MASMLASTPATSVVGRNPVQASLGTSFAGKTISSFPTKKASTSLPSNGMKVKCMQVWPPLGLKKFETLSYLPPLSREELGKEIDYLIRNKWIPCLEFEVGYPFVYREHNKSPGYYDGRYWTMWKLPMYGCTDSSQVLNEVDEAAKAYPQAHVRVIGFDNVRQVQCISFIAYQPK